MLSGPSYMCGLLHAKLHTCFRDIRHGSKNTHLLPLTKSRKYHGNRLHSLQCLRACVNDTQQMGSIVCTNCAIKYAHWLLTQKFVVCWHETQFFQHALASLIQKCVSTTMCLLSRLLHTLHSNHVSCRMSCIPLAFLRRGGKGTSTKHAHHSKHSNHFVLTLGVPLHYGFLLHVQSVWVGTMTALLR